MEFPRIGWYCTSLFPNAITQLGPLHLHFSGASFLGKLTTCPAVFKRKIPGNFTFQIWGFFGFPEFSKFGDLMELDPGTSVSTGTKKLAPGHSMLEPWGMGNVG
jgi:hypothetical protein